MTDPVFVSAIWLANDGDYYHTNFPICVKKEPREETFSSWVNVKSSSGSSSELSSESSSESEGESENERPAFKASNGKQYWEVEMVLDERIRKRKREFLVKWKGFDQSQNTWEPAENLHDCAALDRFLQNKEQTKEVTVIN